MGDVWNMNLSADNDSSIYNTPETTLLADHTTVDDGTNENINISLIASERGEMRNESDSPSRLGVKNLDNSNASSSSSAGLDSSLALGIKSASKRKREESPDSYSIIAEDDPTSDVADLGSDLDSSTRSDVDSSISEKPSLSTSQSQQKSSEDSGKDFSTASPEGENGPASTKSEGWYDDYSGQHFPDTVTLLKTSEGARVYLVGTVHFSTESHEDVSKVIQAVQPHIVFVELCGSRMAYLQLNDEAMLQEAVTLNFAKIRSIIQKNGLASGLLFVFLISTSAHIAEQVGVAPGLEFRRAADEAKKIPGCIIQLGDRPLAITLRRVIAALSWWELIKLMFSLLMDRNIITKEEIEKLKNLGNLDNLLAEMSKSCPAVQHVFVDERDTFMAFSLQLAAIQQQVNEKGEPVPCRVVGVVGLGHMKGIAAKWCKVSSNEVKLISIVPPPSIGTRVLHYTLRASFWGLIIYGLTRFRVVRRNIPSVSGVKAIVSSATNYFRH